MKYDPKIIVLDEFQWLDNYRGDVVGDLKMVWDAYLLKMPGMKRVLCGSIASFMYGKVIRSKALYGGIEQRIHLQAVELGETSQLLRQSGFDEVLLAQMLYGGVPEYIRLAAKGALCCPEPRDSRPLQRQQSLLDNVIPHGSGMNNGVEIDDGRKRVALDPQAPDSFCGRRQARHQAGPAPGIREGHHALVQSARHADAGYGPRARAFRRRNRTPDWTELGANEPKSLS